MSVRSYLPGSWLDEVVPQTGNSPDDFLLRGPDGVLFLSPIAPPDEGESWPKPTPIQPGEMVEFCWHEDRGHTVLQVRPDGTWFLDPPFDGEVNCIVDDSGGDIFAQSVEDYLAQWREAEGADAIEPGPIDLWGWYWSDGDQYRVKVLESGAAHFELVEAQDA